MASAMLIVESMLQSMPDIDEGRSNVCSLAAQLASWSTAL